MTVMSSDRRNEFVVLLVIAGGLIGILLTIIFGLFLSSRPGFVLPNWAENVLISIASVTGLRLGDCLSSLVQLATGRQVERLGNQLAAAPPVSALVEPPPDVAEAAQEVADAAADKAGEIKQEQP